MSEPERVEGAGAGGGGPAAWALAREFDDSSIPEVVPVFVLQDVVLFPHTFLPLHVFETRYRDMVAHALAVDSAGGELIAIASPRPGEEGGGSGGEGPPLVPIAGLGKLIGHQGLPDGRSNIVLLGVARVRIEEYVDAGTSYHCVRVLHQPRRRTPDSGRQGKRLAAELVRFGGELPELRALPGAEQLQDPDLPPLEAVLDQLAAIPFIPFAERQRLLEEDDPGVRAGIVTEALGCAAAFRSLQARSFPQARDG